MSTARFPWQPFPQYILIELSLDKTEAPSNPKMKNYVPPSMIGQFMCVVRIMCYAASDLKITTILI